MATGPLQGNRLNDFYSLNIRNQHLYSLFAEGWSRKVTSCADQPRCCPALNNGSTAGNRNRQRRRFQLAPQLSSRGRPGLDILGGGVCRAPLGSVNPTSSISGNTYSSTGYTQSQLVQSVREKCFLNTTRISAKIPLDREHKGSLAISLISLKNARRDYQWFHRMMPWKEENLKGPLGILMLSL